MQILILIVPNKKDALLGNEENVSKKMYSIRTPAIQRYILRHCKVIKQK